MISDRGWLPLSCFHLTVFGLGKMSALDAEYLVFGFISRIEAKLSSNIIPDPIKLLCFEYYFIAEHFAYHGHKTMINDEKDIAGHTSSDHFHNTLYGNQLIDPNDKTIKKYKWRLKILGFKNSNGLYFGIDSSDIGYLNDNYTNSYSNKNPFYAFTVTRFKRRHDQPQVRHGGDKYKVGDVVCLTLDVEKRTFGLVINDDDKHNYKHKNVIIKDVKYRLAVTLSWDHHKLQLIKYETEKY